MERTYIEICKDSIWTDGSFTTLNGETMQWEPGKPMLLSPNIKDWFIHSVLKKHFTYGQPYCVMCGFSKQV